MSVMKSHFFSTYQHLGNISHTMIKITNDRNITHTTTLSKSAAVWLFRLSAAYYKQ